MDRIVDCGLFQVDFSYVLKIIPKHFINPEVKKDKPKLMIFVTI